jgi:hypothetical protein|tara:strand:+ start:114 stop:557 length:444 start_codon:yes stop_codon:yes gene_type:complete
MSKWDDMDMTGWVSGLTAVDEDTYRKKVVDEETASQADRPALAAKEDLGLLERRLETKLDSIKNVERKIDKLLSLIYDNDSIVEERKQLADSVANKKVNEMAKIVMPLLGSLYRTQNQEYIHWPGRGPIIEKQMEKVEAILDGSFFE